MSAFFTKYDTDLFLFLNGIHSPFWDTVMTYVSGTWEWIPLYLVVVFFIIRRFKWASLYIIPFIVVAIAASDQGCNLVKMSMARLRPCHEPSLNGLIHLVTGSCGGMYGFMSAHAANSFAFACFTAQLFNSRWYTILIYIWAAIVSYSRIYLGVHYPADILCGALYGCLVAYALFFLMDLIKRNAEGKPSRKR